MLPDREKDRRAVAAENIVRHFKRSAFAQARSDHDHRISPIEQLQTSAEKIRRVELLSGLSFKPPPERVTALRLASGQDLQVTGLAVDPPHQIEDALDDG